MEPLSTEAGVSFGLVSEVRRELLDREWADTDNEGLFLSDPASLLLDWVLSYDLGKHDVVACYSVAGVADLEVRIAQACAGRQIRYALAAFSAGARLAPNVRYNRAMAFVEEEALSVAAELGAKKVASGANLQLSVPFDAGIFYDSRIIDGQCVTSPIQTCLDLCQMNGRGDEAADAVLEQVIRPHVENVLVQEGLNNIAAKFASPEHVGPTAVADFLGVEDQDERDLTQRDAHERARALVKGVGLMMPPA